MGGFPEGLVAWLVFSPFLYVLFVAKYMPVRFDWIARDIVWLTSGLIGGAALHAARKEVGSERRTALLIAVIALAVSAIVITGVLPLLEIIESFF